MFSAPLPATVNNYSEDMNMRTYTRDLILPVLIAFALWPAPGAFAASTEQHFETLQIGTETYKNVTVTTRNKNYVFLLHSAGMVNVKVADLSSEEKQLLGYEEPRKASTNNAVTWAKATLQKIESPQLKELEKKVQQGGAPSLLAMIQPMKSSLGFPIIAAVLGVMLGFYLFICYCSKLICKKAGHEPGVLIWLPILQMLPLLRAAGMSPLWFFGMLLPFVNIVAHLVWCVNIAQARGKSFWTAICLILPFTSFFAFLYLAFSNSLEEKEKSSGKSDMLVLNAA